MSSPRSGSRWAAPAASDAPHTSFARSGMKKTGNQPSAIAAVISTFFSPSDAIQIGISLRTGCVNDLERLAESGALLGAATGA